MKMIRLRQLIAHGTTLIASALFALKIDISTALAATPTPPTPTYPLKNPLGTTQDIPTLAGVIIQAILGLVGSVALLMFIWGGFLWLTAAGNPDKIKQGRDTMVWAAVGIAFIFSSYIIVKFIITALHGA